MKKLKIHFSIRPSLIKYCRGIFFKSTQKNMDETSYLLNTSTNAKRLLTSIEDYQKGLGQERSLTE